jgi:glycosyltransferase involved in cell wall biosynthesis
VHGVLKRVLLTTDAVGGVWRYTLELARGFTARGGEVVLADMGPAADAVQRDEAAAIPGLHLVSTGLPLDWLAKDRDQLAGAAQALAALAASFAVDTVHLHTPALASDAAWPAPVVAVAHSCVATWWNAVEGGPLPHDLAWRAHAVADGLDAADAIIAPSCSFAAALRAQYGHARPIHVVRNGRRPVPAHGARGRHILTAGRLWDRGKNVATLDAAASKLDCPVLAAGPTLGPNGTEINCRNLRLLGSLDEAALAREYRQAALFVSLARYEPFGLAVLEAAQAGCALVLSDIPTFRELWDGVAVFLPSTDIDGTASALNQLSRDPARCDQLGRLAAIRADKYNPDAMAAATWAVHQSVLDARVIRTAA